MIAFIDMYRHRFTTAAICRVLNKYRVGGFFSERGYYLAKQRGQSRRAQEDAKLLPIIVELHRQNYSVYGIRKMHVAMQRAGFEIGRDRVARLMRLAGLRGKIRGRGVQTTIRAHGRAAADDLVHRNFSADAPNQLWVADITYVPLTNGHVYTALLSDVFSRKIVGWAVRSTLTTEALPLEALNQAIGMAQASLETLVHHSDKGSQYTSLRYTEHLAQHGISPSTGTTGDSYDNALAESINGLYKTELIHPQRWSTCRQVEQATCRWVHWWNTERLHSSLGMKPPQEIEDEYYKHQQPPQGFKHNSTQ